MSDFRIVAALLSAVTLSGCGCSEPFKSGKTDVVPGSIRDISFQSAHEYDDCGAKRGCRTVAVPDTWFLNLCSREAKNDCRVRAITHAPWKWQTEGAPITITWQTSCSFSGGGYWYINEFSPAVDSPPKNGAG